MSHLDKVINYLETTESNEKVLARIEKLIKQKKEQKLLDAILADEDEFQSFCDYMTDHGGFSDQEVVMHFFGYKKSVGQISERAVVEILKQYDHVFAHAWLASKMI